MENTTELLKGFKWNYEDPSKNVITEDFKREYYTDIKGVPAVKSSGLKVLASIKGIKSLTTNVIQFPNDSNKNTCIVQATLVGYDWSPIEGKIVETTYSEIGDANTSNCNKMIGLHFIRMASTRAVGRVLRMYTNIGLVCADELGGSVVEERKEMATAKQINFISSMVNSVPQSDPKFIEAIKELTKRGVNMPTQLTKEECSDYINAVKSIFDIADKNNKKEVTA